MILRCAALMSSGSARAIAFRAASRSPRLIASSTDRTELRIWVRRDLLMMVRRAILRVAFLAEVVLAIFSIVLRQYRSQASVSVPTVRLIVAEMLFYGALLENATWAHRLGRRAHAAAMLKEQRRRDCARRHCRSYRGRSPHRQRLLAAAEPGGRRAKRPIRC